ncbi:MAG: glycoside hydrolase family 3 protein [candidate division Zixibacteria bacterium]|nr:glycoside hydrolase family 3 protein [candidate division Zixibacteria bacterium]
MTDKSIKAGQLLTVGFSGKTILSSIKRLIDNNNLGGIILFARNGDSLEDFRALIETIKNGHTHQPLVFIDQEGGDVSRIKLDGELGYSAAEWTKKDDLRQFKGATRNLASSLTGCGFDVNTVPVMDMPSSEDIPVLKGRCYGDIPEEVNRYTSIIIDTYKETNLIPCGKHFPGLGDVNIDPHKDMPYDKSDAERYYKHKFLPFINAIANKIPMIMTTHIVAEVLDNNNPATFSNIIVNRILKDELGFKGLVVSDDLEMGAIAQNYKWEDCITGAIEAGHEMLLICHSEDRQLKALEIIADKIKKDEAFRIIVENAVNKVLTIKEKHFK